MNQHPKVAIIIPAWNEEGTIKRAIESASKQIYPNKTIIVAVDNSTDNTYCFAIQETKVIPNLVVFRTVNNKAKKAGGLNQAINNYCYDAEYILVMDADTTADEAVVTEAVKILSKNKKIGAVCALTHLTDIPKKSSLSQKTLWQMQKLEYATADSRRFERPEDFQILAGSCVMYRKAALESVAKVRGVNQYYDEKSLIEDYELTISLKEAGWKVTIGRKMHSWTDVPLSFSVLWHQRIRWARSHIDTLRQKGWNKVTGGDIVSHIAFVFLLAQQLFFLSLVLYFVLFGIDFTINPLIVPVLGLFWLDRMIRLKYVHNLNLIDVAIRALYLPEELYGLLHSAQRIYSYYLSLVNGPEVWLET